MSLPLTSDLLRWIWQRPAYLPKDQVVELDWVKGRESPTLCMLTWRGVDMEAYRWWEIEIEPYLVEITGSKKQFVRHADEAIRYLCAILFPFPRPLSWRLFSRRRPVRCRRSR